MLMLKLKSWHFQIFFFFFHHNKAGHFMQTILEMICIVGILSKQTDDKQAILYLFFTENRAYPQETVWKKCQVLFSGKHGTNILKCHQLIHSAGLRLIFTTLGKFSRWQIRKQDLTFHANYLLKRQFALKYQNLISGKNKKNYSKSIICWYIYPACKLLKPNWTSVPSKHST